MNSRRNYAAMPAPARAVRMACLLLGSSVLLACWDSVAAPIRIAADGALDMEPDAASGAPPRDGGVTLGDVPNNRHCEPASDWPEEWARAELAMFAAINELRDGRTRCAGREYRDLQPLRLAPELRCAARLHSIDMVNRDFVDQVNPSFETPDERVAQTGARYPWRIEESVDDGGTDYAQVLESLRQSRVECAYLLNPAAIAVGIGLYREHWTLDFGR